MTPAERLVWYGVRDRRLGGLKFKRQWTVGRYVVDFCCLEQRLILEIDGGQHSAEADAERTRCLTDLGYRVVRFWNNEVTENIDGVLTALLAELNASPHPGPLPQAGEGE